MSTEPETQTIPTEDQTGSEPDSDRNQNETGSNPESESNPNSEAAKYRTRLREVEAERDQLRGQLEAARKQVAEAASGLTRPAALWAAGVEVDSLFTDSGELDQDKLTAAVTAAADLVGAETRQARANRAYWSGGPFGKTTGSGGRDSFADAFRPRDR